MRGWTLLASVGVLAALTGTVAAQRKPAPRPAPTKPAPAKPAAQVVTPPKARYAMDVGTTSGLAGMMGGGKPSLGDMMRMASGGGNRESHTLHLRLGSVLAPTGGAPRADHYFLPPADMGPSVPLLTPQRTVATADRPDEPERPNFERPRGRLILFWGCGAHAPAGQPVIIDFANLAAGQVPPDLFTSRVSFDRGPSVNNSRTYGDWPNARSGRMPQAGTLLGQHRIAGNYAPEIAFSLQQDYMPGIQLQTSLPADGTVALNWSPVSAATGYYAWLIGASGAGRKGRGDAGDIVWWSSSASRDFGGALWDWISPSVVAGLVRDGTVMAPITTSCLIPAEVRKATGEGMFGNLIAYGPEENFVYPPRPDKGPWTQEWTARVRFRSMTSFLPGMDMGESRGSDNRREPPRKRCKPSLLGAVTGLGC